jgi:2-polyprenyl-6-methoxyphenol hydroxylase-like FAD-dependent oxidoreductase
LALALRRRGFANVCVFEKDASAGCRRAGYGLTIQQAVPFLLELGLAAGGL